MTCEGIEIERTYLLRQMPVMPAGTKTLRIEQGYLPPAEGRGTLEGRVRRTSQRDGSVELTHTIKQGVGLVRSEQERSIGPEEFARLWPRTVGRRLTKTRHLLPVGALVWTVDDFDDLDLVLAEVELPDPATVAPIPDWLAPHVEREVTEEPAYRNYELARRAGVVATREEVSMGVSDKVILGEEEWRQRLSDEQYRITREAGTEPAFTGKYWKTKTSGTYRCACCGHPLFNSETKFDSGTGWPSFSAPIHERAVTTCTDESHGMSRNEVLCRRCDAHLGHVFDDGPTPTGQRYCLNSASLDLDDERGDGQPPQCPAE